jgi:hypothetical protein
MHGDASVPIAQSLARGLHEAYGRLRARPALFGLLASVTALIGLVYGLTPIPTGKAGADDILLALDGCELVGFVALFFIIADAVRTEQPAFRMTIGTFFMTLVFGWGYLFLVAAGVGLFVVPGIYLAGKLAPCVPYYLLGDDAPFAHAMRDTTGRYWQTLGMILMLWLGADVALLVVFAAVALGISALPLSAVVLAPIAFLWACYVMSVVWLSWIHYCAALRRFYGPVGHGSKPPSSNFPT